MFIKITTNTKTELQKKETFKITNINWLQINWLQKKETLC